MNATQSSTKHDPSRSTTSHRLVFPHGGANLTVRVDESMPDVYRGVFTGPQPVVTEAEGVISIDYPRFNLLSWGQTSADISISPRVAWVIEIRGGVAHWDADLRTIELRGIEVRGGLSHVNLRLPQPKDTVRVHISGGASDLTLRRPAQSGARVEIGRGASRLTVDDQVLGAVGGPVALATSGYQTDRDNYRVEIDGGASKLTVAPE